jgi:hypothetical protein
VGLKRKGAHRDVQEIGVSGDPAGVFSAVQATFTKPAALHFAPIYDNRLIE